MDMANEKTFSVATGALGAAFGLAVAAATPENLPASAVVNGAVLGSLSTLLMGIFLNDYNPDIVVKARPIVAGAIATCMIALAAHSGNANAPQVPSALTSTSISFAKKQDHGVKTELPGVNGGVVRLTPNTASL